MKNVMKIYFPNTYSGENGQNFFEKGRNCDDIKQILKNGEMAEITWFQIIKDNKVIAEIKESVCDIFGEDDIE